VADRRVAADLPDAVARSDEFVRALPPGGILAERRGAAEMAVPADLAGEGSAGPPEAVRRPVEARRFLQELFPQDSLPLVAAPAAIRLAAVARLPRVRRRAARVKPEKWDALGAEPDGPRERVRRDLPPPESALLVPMPDEAERREWDLQRAHLLVALLAEPLLEQLRSVEPVWRREPRAPLVSQELPREPEPLRASARFSLSPRPFSPLLPLLRRPRDRGNASEPFRHARYRWNSSASFSPRRRSWAKSRSGLWP
jgi:hypothetical protein